MQSSCDYTQSLSYKNRLVASKRNHEKQLQKINLENMFIFNRLVNTGSDLQQFELSELSERNQRHKKLLERLQQFKGK